MNDLEAYLEQRHKTLIEEFCSKAERPIALAVPDTFPAYAVNGSYCLGLPMRRAAIIEPAFIWRNQETEKLSHTRLRQPGSAASEADERMSDLAEFLLARNAELEEFPAEGDPIRVLAECKAREAIVEHAQHWFKTKRSTPEGWTAETATAYRMAMEWTLMLLALPYADHPDYQREWRP
jgi:hypothetical protein